MSVRPAFFYTTPMKIAATVLTVASLIALTCAADSYHAELDAARTRYETALSAATKPVREKYAAELQQLKNRAMTMKNLELAVAIDQEIKTIGVAVPSSPGTSVATSKLSAVLPNSTWTPENGAGFYTSISFTADGAMIRKPKSGTASRDAYEMEKDGDTVSFKRADGVTVRLRFSSNRRSFQMNSITYEKAEP